jgi:hypothetical protein
MESLPNVSHLLSDEWAEFWTDKNETVLPAFDSMSQSEQEWIL